MADNDIRAKAIPTQTDEVSCVKFDYCDGCRVVVPHANLYEVRMKDTAHHTTEVFIPQRDGEVVRSSKRYCVPIDIEVVYRTNHNIVFSKKFDLTGKDVLLKTNTGAIGDTIAWFSYMDAFQKKHNCNLYVCIMPQIADLFRGEYPNIHFVTNEEASKLNPYAMYDIGIWFQGAKNCQPVDYRDTGLHLLSADILGLTEEDRKEQAPRVNLSAPRKIKEKYVCISVQGSMFMKTWTNVQGWRKVIAELKNRGYRVFCIDRNPEWGCGYTFTKIPFGCEDDTGEKPLQERIDMIKDAEFFIGLPSGLSWVAWCTGVPIIMISGMSRPYAEFDTPYRVSPPEGTCYGCWNDRGIAWRGDFFFCPRQRDAEDKLKFQCTRRITADMVISMIDKVEQDKKEFAEKVLKQK